MLQGLLDHIEFLDQQIARFDERIEEQTRPFGPAIERLDTIPGVGRRSAEQILAELGDDMRRFPTAAQAASWSGICPGNHESAGKRRSGRTRKGNAWLRATLVESARAAVRTRRCYDAGVLIRADLFLDSLLSLSPEARDEWLAETKAGRVIF